MKSEQDIYIDWITTPRYRTSLSEIILWMMMFLYSFLLYLNYLGINNWILLIILPSALIQPHMKYKFPATKKFVASTFGFKPSQKSFVSFLMVFAVIISQIILVFILKLIANFLF